MLAPLLTRSLPGAASASVVVITGVDGVLRAGDTRSLAEVRPALEALARDGCPVVLCADDEAAEVAALQRELGLRHPFICEGGTALHIPAGYFCGLPDSTGDTGWEVIDFGTRRLCHAVRLTVTLYRAAGAPVIVGVGADWRHRALLREVDAPIVVRNPAVDQTGLLRNVPHAYVTEAAGPAGWSEAIFGHCSVGRA